MATRRRHEPKELGRRLGSQALVKRARQRKSSKGSAASGPVRLAFWKKKAGDRAPKRLPRYEGDELIGVRRRVKVVLLGLGLAACVVLGRSVQLQLFDSAQYVDAADGQARMSALIKAKRGVIEDRNGAELAISVDVDSVYANPRVIPAADVPHLAKRLSGLLGVSAKRIEDRLSSKRAFVYLRRRVPADVAQKVRDMKVRGLATRPEPKRFYSNVGLGAHVLGFTNYEGEGKAGVERVFDEDLQGSSMRVPGLRDALGNHVFSEGFTPDAVLEGSDITLTLDRHIQHATERALEEAVTGFEAKAGVALVMEPSTGDVLAMASYPSYNPNDLSGSTASDRKNRAVSAVYEPGSTVKLVTLSAAIEEELVRPDSELFCEDGAWRYGGHTIHDTHPYGDLSVTEVLQKSSNICSAKVGIMLERKRLYAWLRKFGIGEKTGIEVPGELRGLLAAPDRWRDIRLANIAFGQGLALTPLQILQAASTIANGGVRMAPRVVRKVADKRGRVEVAERPEGLRVVSERTARAMTEMMTKVTGAGGTAPAAAVPGFAVAGKTGTAQKIDPVTKGYSKKLYTASFVGFVPADRPEVAILVLVDEPKGSIYGGTVAAPAFKKIALAALSARNVFPDGAEAREAFLASYRPEPLPEAAPGVSLEDPEVDKWSDSHAEDGAEGFGEAFLAGLSERAQAMIGAAPAALEVPEKPSGAHRMPNFAGLKLHEVLNRSAEVRCDPVVQGTGRVVKQSPRAQSPIEPGAPCTFTLAPQGSGRGRGSGA